MGSTGQVAREAGRLFGHPGGRGICGCPLAAGIVILGLVAGVPVYWESFMIRHDGGGSILIASWQGLLSAIWRWALERHLQKRRIMNRTI